MSLPPPGQKPSRRAGLSGGSQKKPRKPSQSPIVSKEIADAAEARSAPLVLIIDDHPDTGLMVQRALKRRGVESICAFSAREGWDAAHSQKPSLIILDEMMPDESGLDLLRKLHTDPTLASIPVLFYSAAYEWAKQSEAEAMGVRAWVVKGTVKMTDFIDLIQKNA